MTNRETLLALRDGLEGKLSEPDDNFDVGLNEGIRCAIRTLDEHLARLANVEESDHE